MAAVTTALAGGLGIDGLLEALGTNFVANRSMAIFIMILLVTGVLEANGLREAAADLMKNGKERYGRPTCVCIWYPQRVFWMRLT